MERQMKAKEVIEVVDGKTAYLDMTAVRDAGGGGRTGFTFDQVFPPNSTQEDVFEKTAMPLADEVMNGFNCTVFAYGQTGSGKTHTMMGVPDTDDEGIIPRLTDALFEHIEDADEQIEFTVKISYVEIYMEQIRDLLEPSKTNLRVREGNRGIWIQDVTERYVSSVEEILEIMAIGDSTRAVAATNMNEHSSRSHSVFMVTVGQRNKVTGSKKGAKLILVDLAGSETVKKTGSTGSTLKEAQHINRSLSALGNVINALTTNSPHIPYRDSKLTRLLTDSLGGNSKTCLIVTASPSSFNAEETLSTLRFGVRAKKIKNKPIVNQEKSVAEYKILLQAAVNKCTEQEEIISKLKADIEELRNALKSGGSLPADHQDLQDKEKLLEETKEKGGNINSVCHLLCVRELVTGCFGCTADVNALTEHAERSSVVLANLELQGEMDLLRSELKEKEDMLVDTREQLSDVSKQIEDLSEELRKKDEQISEMRGQMFDVSKESERVDKAEYESLQSKLAALEKEQDVYLKQIDQLQNDNLELAQLKDIHMSSLKALGGAVAPPSTYNDAQKQAFQAGLLAGQKTADASTDERVQQAEKKLSTLKTNYDVLMAALGRKCEQYIELQMKFKGQADQLQNMEKKTLDKGPVQDARAAAKIKELEKRLEASDKLCQKLFQSGLYWQKRGQRKDTELKESLHRNELLVQALERKRRGGSQDANSSNPARALLLGVSHLKKGSVSTSSSSASSMSSGLHSRGNSGGSRHRTTSSAKVLMPKAIAGGHRGTQPRPGKPDFKRLDSMDAFF